MLKLGRSIFNLTHQQNPLSNLRPILSPHLFNILSNQHERYQHCLHYMHRATEQFSQDKQKTKLQCNILFNVHSCQESLTHLRPLLSELVLSGQVSSQYQLDQLLKWLTKEVKVNSNVGEEQIRGQLRGREQEEESFYLELKELEEKKQLRYNQSNLCKWLRSKYTRIDSQHIFSCVKKLFLHKKPENNAPQETKMFWDKLGEIKPRQLKIECNSKEATQQHLEVTQGKLRFRFPPEPNGYLHIGHVKSIRINFEAAKRHGGSCYLRFDDTNPDKESHEFIEEIEQNIKWLGYTPDKISFASDYFEPMMHYAHELIKQGNAYVCESLQEQIEAERREKRSNPFRDRPITDSLRIFPKLTGNQTLRLKDVPAHPNPTLRDPIIYRQKTRPHPRTDQKYRIYPTYDFAHCLGDSLQHIDFSLCSLQFQIRRELYYTFLNLLGLWKPFVWEYSRLNIEGNVLSKRKIKDLIDQGRVDDWSDPRLLTIRGLQARGYSPQMLFSFIDKVSCSRSGNQNIVQNALLEQQMKKILLKKAPKAMGVLSPFKITIKNIQDVVCDQNVSNQFSTQIQSQIFIENSDAKMLTIGAKVILKNIGIFEVEEKDETVLKLTFLKNQDISQLKKTSQRVKILHWINKSQGTPFKVVTFDKLLNTDNTLNPQSKQEYRQSLLPRSLITNSPEYVQLERVGFFKFSPDKDCLLLCARH